MEQPDLESVLTEVRVWMTRRGVNQSDLAEALGVVQSWVSKRLSGQVTTSVEDLLRIAVALDVDVVEFFRRS